MSDESKQYYAWLKYEDEYQPVKMIAVLSPGAHGAYVVEDYTGERHIVPASHVYSEERPADRPCAEE